MAIKLKTKIALGGLFFFALLITVTAVSFFYFNKVSLDAENIVRDNYETLNYSREMLRALDSLDNSGLAFDIFEKNLRLQENNITEPGERKLTEYLRQNFNTLKEKGKADSLAYSIRSNINDIMKVNLKAIDTKNKAALAAADKAKTIVTICITICLLLGFTFLFNFPSLVASPVAKLTEGIKAVANKNYSERIHLNRKDEFGELAEAFNTMAERLNEYEHSNLAKILFEKQRAEAVINSLKDASIGIDKKGVVLFANQQAVQLLNLNEQEIIGVAKEEIMKRNDLFRFLINEQSSSPFKIVVEGKENYFIKEVMELSHEGEKTGNVIVLKNITPFKELDVAKTNFIATVSHELKTPLASSDFTLKLLEDERVGSLTSGQRELVESLKEDNKRLLRILSELLDMSQVESGKIQLLIREVQPAELIEKAVLSVLNTAKQRNIIIKREVADNLPLINADADKTTWVLNNFLTNAIRYSADNAEIIVTAQLIDNRVEFSVQDFGKGIDPRFKDKIFDRYFKIPGNKEGSGLGLAICKEFIDAQGGSISVISEPGKGSRFSFSL
jgi:signal transduction histidine kinase